MPITWRVLGFQIRAWVSPPQDRVSHMVHVAASMAQAASTALPPFWNIMEPAVAAKGFPVIASQWRACSTGLAVRAVPGRTVTAMTRRTIAADSRTKRRIRECSVMNSLLDGGSLQEGTATRRTWRTARRKIAGLTLVARAGRRARSEAPLLGAQTPAAPLGPGSSLGRPVPAAAATTWGEGPLEAAAARPLGGLVHPQLAAAELLAIELLDRRLRLRRGGELDEGHAAGTSGRPVEQDEDVDDLAGF